MGPDPGRQEEGPQGRDSTEILSTGSALVGNSRVTSLCLNSSFANFSGYYSPQRVLLRMNNVMHVK